MSRKIERGQKLSEDDRKYLADRPSRRAELGLTLDDLNVEEPDAPDEYVNIKDAPRTAKELAEQAKRIGATTGTPQPDAAPYTDAPEDDDYDEWSKSDLQDECERRDLPKSGKVADLVARLRENDADADNNDGE